MFFTTVMLIIDNTPSKSIDDIYSGFVNNHTKDLTPYICFLTPLQQETFSKIFVAKRRNCSKQAMAPFATIFSIYFATKTLIYGDFFTFLLIYSFKVVYCIFINVGKN